MARKVVRVIAAVVVMLAALNVPAGAQEEKSADKRSARALTAVAGEKNATSEEVQLPAVAVAKVPEKLSDLSGERPSATNALSSTAPSKPGIGSKLARSASGSECTVFDNQGDFELALQAGGKNLRGVETFEEAALPPASIASFDDPVCGGIPNLPDGFPFPNGLEVFNLCVQANVLGGAPDVPAPDGDNGLAAFSTGFQGAASDGVVANFFLQSFDLTLDEEAHDTAVGFNPLAFLGDLAVDIKVFNTSNMLLATSGSPADPAGSSFWGIWCEEPIGRINVFDPGNGAEGGDNIQMWTTDEITCGNDVCEPDEGETCKNCLMDCGVCPVCGDDEVNQPGEECDGDDDAACAVGCGANCLCLGRGDSCLLASPITAGPTPFDTTGASTDGLPHPRCEFDGQTYHDIWFSFVGGFFGTATLSTCNNADYDTDLAVYDGCYPDMPCPPGDEYLLGCNDDASGCTGFTSEVTVPTVQGNCYTVRVGGWNEGDQGTGILTGPEPECGGDPAPCDHDGICETEQCGEQPCSCDDCLGNCCTFYVDQAEFETTVNEQGLKFLGVEDFEESILLPASVDALDDPLCGGIPNLPDGFPFPNGLDAPNLCVQSNVLGGEADVPAPAGDNGLAAASVGFLGAVSDVVLANNFDNSLDVVFEDGSVTALGMNTLAFLGGTNVAVTVHWAGVGPWKNFRQADPAGTYFFGVVCDGPIARINIFDPGNGAEGADNIQLWFSTPDCGECLTDIDGDGDTGPFDLAYLLGFWGSCAPGDQCVCLDADDDGLLGPADLAVLLGAWGPCE